MISMLQEHTPNPSQEGSWTRFSLLLLASLFFVPSAKRSHQQHSKFIIPCLPKEGLPAEGGKIIERRYCSIKY